MRLATAKGNTATAATTAAPATHPSACAPGGAARRGGGRDPGRDQQQPADDVADAGEVAPVGTRVDHVQAVGDDAEADREEADDDAEHEPRRTGDVRLGERPRHGNDDDHRDAEHRRVGPREREVEQVRGDEHEPGEQERALGAGGARRDRLHAPTVADPAPAHQRAAPWTPRYSTGV